MQVEKEINFLGQNLLKENLNYLECRWNQPQSKSKITSYSSWTIQIQYALHWVFWRSWCNQLEPHETSQWSFKSVIRKVDIFWEGHKIWQNLHLSFDITKVDTISSFPVQQLFEGLTNQNAELHSYALSLVRKYNKLESWQTWDDIDLNNVKTKTEISSNFVAFSENLIFTQSTYALSM